jgi:hypothetical protein
MAFSRDHVYPHLVRALGDPKQSKKLVAPAGLRAVVSCVEVEYQMSQRHARRLMGLDDRRIAIGCERRRQFLPRGTYK